MKKSRKLTPQECKTICEKFYSEESARLVKEFKLRKQVVIASGEEWDLPRRWTFAGIKVAVRSIFQRWF